MSLVGASAGYPRDHQGTARRSKLLGDDECCPPAECRVGQLLAEKERRAGVRMNGKDESGDVRTAHAGPSEYQQAKSDAGISDTQAKR